MTEEQEIIRILLIEDDREHARIISKAFKRHGEGMVATVAGTLREARALLAETTPHLVIADLRLPDGDGMEILPTDKDSAQFPVVVVTAHGDEQAAVAALKAGALDYVVKSTLNLADLPRVASRAVREWRHIVEQKRAEEALRASEARYRAVVETQTELICRYPPDGTITFVNDAYCRYFDKPREALLGHKFMPLIPEEDHERVQAHFASLGPENPVATHEHRAIGADGRIRWQQWTNSVIFDEQGNAIELQGVGRDITKRKQAEEELQKAHDELERRVEERTAELAKERRLLKEMLELQELERKLVSYEIHDGLAQQLAGAQMRLQAFSQPRNQMPEAARKAFDGGLQLLAEAMNETRRLISGLRPPILDESGVVTAVDYLVQELNGREELEIEFHHDVQFDRLAAPLEAAIFRIVQESLSNACRHSQSEKVRVELTGKNSLARIEVRDWGVGFDPDNVDRNRYGLQGLRERARLFKGRTTIDSAPGKGTRIVAELPIPTEGEKPQ